MKYFICSMANDGHKNIVELLTDRVGQLEKFAEDHDQPRRAVYACVNPLKDSATRRGKDEVAEIVTRHVDIDFKRLATPPDEVRRKPRERRRPARQSQLERAIRERNRSFPPRRGAAHATDRAPVR
jgi:hypothetical protein